MVDAISSSSFKNLAYKASIKEMSSHVYPALRLLLEEFLKKAVSDSIIYAQHANRTTVRTSDIEMALTGIPGAKKIYRAGEEGSTSRCANYDTKLGKERVARKAKKSVETFSDTDGTRRTSRGVAAIRKIKFYQKQVDCFYFARQTFERIVKAYGPDIRWSANAVGFLQLAAEDFILRLITKAYYVTVADNRTKLKVGDVKTVVDILDIKPVSKFWEASTISRRPAVHSEGTTYY